MYLDEPDTETDEPDVLRRLRPRPGDAVETGLFLGDLDRRQGSFHSSARFTAVVATASFLGASTCRLESTIARSWF